MKQDVTAAEFISALFKFTDDNFGVYFCSLANERDDPLEKTGERHTLTRDIDEMERFVAKWDRQRRGLFYCVSTIANNKRNKANARQITGAHGDIDFKGLDVSEQEVWAAIGKLRHAPTIIVRSGNGLHLYWLFHEPLDLTPANIERVEAVMRQLADHVAGDLAVCEVARLMRLPGTHNSKGGSWKEVSVERIGGPRYELDDLEEWMVESAPVLRRKLVAGTVDPSDPSVSPVAGTGNPFLAAAKLLGFKPPVDVEARLAAMAYGGAGDSSIHFTQLSVSAALLNAGVEIDEVVTILLEATRAAAGEYAPRWNWAREEKTIRKMCLTWLAKHPQPIPTHSNQFQPEPETAGSAAPGASQDEEATAEVHDLGAARAKKKARAKKAAATALHIILGEALLAVLEQRGERVMFTNKGTYRHKDGLWWLETDPEVQTWLDSELEAAARALSMESTSRLINEARKWIIRNPDLRREDIAFDAHGMIPTRSGLVHPRTGKLTAPDPAQYVTWRTACRYDPTAECPLWLEMVRDVFADRTADEIAQYVSLLQEMAGAGLIDLKAKALSKALVLWGGQDSGKSGLLEVISGIYDTDANTTSLSSLDGNHGTMAFLKRRPWVLYEAFNQNVWHLSSSVKTIISGEPIQVNVKNGPLLSHRFKGPILWATNHAPQFREATKAIVERMVILPCRQLFLAGKPIGVAAKARRLGFSGPAELVIATELEGVLAWAVEGLRRALERGYFEIPAEALETGHQVRLDSNIVAEFIEDCVTFDPDAMISTADFSAAHASWWVEHKGEDTRLPSGNAVGRAINSLGEPRIAAHRTELKDIRKRYYAGVSLNDMGKMHWKNAVTADHFTRMGKTASTTEAAGDPFRTIPKDWASRPTVLAMRLAHSKEPPMTNSKNGSQNGSDAEPAEKPDGIYF